MKGQMGRCMAAVDGEQMDGLVEGWMERLGGGWIRGLTWIVA